MAGHSKWANIKHKKKKEDAKRGKIFTKLIRELTIAARIGGGGDIDANPRLRAAVDKAYANNMSKDTVVRAIKRGSGESDGETLEEIVYEGYGPGGVAVMVECMTDNRNRTVSEVRHAFTKCGGNLGTDGSVSYLFKKEGLILFPATVNEDKLMEVAIELGARDVAAQDDGTWEVTTEPEEYFIVEKGLKDAGLIPEESRLNMRPTIEVTLDKEVAEKMIRLLDMLEDLDDVQEVHSNADIPYEILNELME